MAERQAHARPFARQYYELVSARSELIEGAFAAHARGELKPLVDVLNPGVVWLGVEGRGENGGTACCENRSHVVARLTQLYERGRRFRVVDQAEHEASVAVGLELADPDWDVTVTVWKLFRFDSEGETIVQIQDCVGREEAIAALLPA
jgi:hypothetical protein